MASSNTLWPYRLQSNPLMCFPQLHSFTARHTGLTVVHDPPHVIRELSRMGLRHDDLVPGQPSGLAGSDVT